MRCVSHKTERAYVCHSDYGGGGTLFIGNILLCALQLTKKTQMNVWHASKFSELCFSRSFFPCGYQLHGLSRRPFELHEDGCGGV